MMGRRGTQPPHVWWWTITSTPASAGTRKRASKPRLLPEGFELRQVEAPGPEFPPVSTAVGLSLRDRSLDLFYKECLEAGLSVGFEVDVLGGRG